MKFFTLKLSFILGLFLVVIAKDQIDDDKTTFSMSNRNSDKDGNSYILVKVKNDKGMMVAKTVAEEVRVKLDDGSGIMGLTVTKEQEEALRMSSNIESIEIDHKVYPLNEPMKHKNFTRNLLEAVPWGIKAVLQDNLEFFENVGNPSQPFKVCVGDTGIDLAHEDLPKEPNVIGKNGYDEDWFVDLDGHGTHVAGTVAAIGNNNIGVTSVIPNNKGGKFQLVITKAMTNEGYGTVSGILAAVTECVNMGAKVVSLSLGCERTCFGLISDGYFKQKFEDEGILIIAASGNYGNDEMTYPASYGSVISVASVDEALTRSSFSQYNDQVELSAPGSNILSTWRGNQYTSQFGTSMATPHVSAVAGLVWSYFPSCQAYQIRNVLDKTAKDLSAQGCDIYYGYGLVQAIDAYNLLSAGNCGGNLGSSSGVGGCGQITFSPTSPPPTPSPTLQPPVPIPTSTPINPPPTPTNCAQVTVTIITDDYPQETTFQVVNLNGIQFMSGGPYTGQRTEYTDTSCLPYDTYQFIIRDSYSDGICCNYGDGAYNLFVNGALINSGNTFTDSETITFSTSNAPTSPPNGNCMNVIVTIKTDNYPQETSYKVMSQTGTEFMSGGDYTIPLYEYAASSCLPNSNVYEFTIYDAYGDGICCQHGDGAYNLLVNGALIKSGGQFTNSETTTFPASSPIPAPTNPPVPGPSISVYVIIKTDDYPEETSFTVTNLNGIEFMAGNSYTEKLTEYIASASLPSNVYQFTIYDTAGDGLCCLYGEGGYNLFVNGVYTSGGTIFTTSDTTTFGEAATAYNKNVKTHKYMKPKESNVNNSTHDGGKK